MMGSLSRFNLSALCTKYNCRYFVETGTGSGKGIEVAKHEPFEKIFSIEIIPMLARLARKAFEDDPRIEIMQGESYLTLGSILSQIPFDAPILFWLDAHFPGSDYNLAAYDSEKETDVRLPLRRELETIKASRSTTNDVIIIDDLRIYLDGPFTAGVLPDFAQTLPLSERNIDFIYDLFGKTHTVQKWYQDEGYAILAPKHTALGWSFVVD